MLNVYHSTLESNLLSFARKLRHNRFLIGPNEISLALLSLSYVDIREREDVFLALQAVLAKSPSEQTRFAKFFAEFWDGGLLQELEFQPQLNLPPESQLCRACR